MNIKTEDFKEGLRVEAIANFHCVKEGMLGTVLPSINESKMIGVRWDLLTSGHSCDKNCEPSKGYYLPPERLLILTVTLKQLIEK